MRLGCRAVSATLVAILATMIATISAGASQAVERIGGSTSQAERTSGSADPNDVAMIFSVQTPCTAPCWKQGLVYQRTGSALSPEAGVQPYAMDVYRSSRTPRRDAPVILLIHGGGFVTGDRTQMRPQAEVLAKAGFLVASIDYRKVPESRNGGVGIASEEDLIPASAEVEADAQRALRWIRANRATLGAASSTRRYAVGGYSAGAIAALRVAVRGGDRSTPASLRVRVGAAFAIAGTECGAWTRGFGCAAAYDRNDPPIRMFHGQADSVVPFSWGRSTCEQAQRRGGGCKGYFYPGQDHFWPNGVMLGSDDRRTRAQPAVLPAVAQFLRRQLRPQ